ncbi:MAG: FAD-dependent oxidoreductase [Gemmatimonadetes bacterium]|nr:FAD-dependent oxidoreductase [Gemmatimonadota bacterium]
MSRRAVAATRRVQVREGGAYDVIVVGGGPSGALAGIAAARAGGRTLVVEQHGFFGGSLTAMGVGPMMSFHNNVGEQVVRGLPQELIDRLVARGASPGHIEDSTTYVTTVTPFDSEALKMELERMLLDAGGDPLFHTQLAAVQLDDESRIAEVLLSNKAGLTAYRAATFVDASGDGDLAARAGVPFILGRERDGATQPMTMNLKVGNVDTERIRRYALENPDDFVFAHGVEEGLDRLKRTPRLSLAGFRRAWDAAKGRGEVDVPREHVLFFETATPGVVIVNTSRVQGLDATDPLQLSRAELIGRQQCAQIFDFLRRHCPGFEDAVRMDAAAQIGVRESRHVEGLYTVTAEDLATQRAFPDPVALGGYPIDVHSPEEARTESVHFRPGTTYQIPMRALLVAEPANLVIAGRCISATHEAMAAFRVTPIAMAIGQAAGAIAALSAARRTPPAELAYEEVRDLLVAQGARLPEPSPP